MSTSQSSESGFLISYLDMGSVESCKSEDIYDIIRDCWRSVL